MRHFRRFASPTLVALALVSACSSDIPTTPTPSPITATTGVLRQLTAGIPNSKKYHDTGIHPATGRSGSASIEARALLGMDGSTTVEVTTGSLENNTHSGTIAKVQLKAGETQNFNGLTNTGYWSTTAAGLSRGQPVQVQANVRGIDPRRTDVVTVTSNVARRPDVKVEAVSAPATAPPGTQVLVSANVSEINADVGARADCVLSIDGAAVDHADGIWIDAGSTVSCMFSYAFTAGTHSIAVSAANVAPGDWDLSNNSASTSISVAHPGTPIQRGWINAQDTHYGYDYWDQVDYYDGSTNRSDYNYQYDASFVYAYGYDFNGGFVPHPIQRTDVTVSVDGAQAFTGSAAAYWTDAYDNGSTSRYACTYMSDNAGVWGYVCSYDFYGNGAPYVYYNAQVNHGTVTFLGSNTFCDYLGACNTYVWSNYTTVYEAPNSLGFAEGSRVGLEASFLDAGGSAHTMNATTDPLYRYDYGPWNNYSYCPGGSSYYSNYCYGTTYTAGFYTYGYGNWYNP